jgi:hypothetical protein
MKEQSMKTAGVLPLSDLHERDETAWLEMMSALAAAGRYADLGWAHLTTGGGRR